MYLVKKCENFSHGKNKWELIFSSPDREGALAIYNQERKLLYEADHNLNRTQIDTKMTYGSPNARYWSGARYESGHYTVRVAIYKSNAAEYKEPARRPMRTELLDKILS